MGYGDVGKVSLNGNIGKIKITENLIVFFVFYFVFIIVNIFKTSKSINILWNWLSAKFPFALNVFINSQIGQKQARIFFIFLKTFLKQTWNAFNTKFQPQWKDRKSSYQVRQILGLFSDFIALILG